MTASDVTRAFARVRAASRLVLLLDYDGTLVDLVDDPADARPDDALCSLLDGLARRRATQVHIVSGRPRQVLERWLGHLPIGLFAEHGLWWRPALGSWEPLVAIPDDALAVPWDALKSLVAACPGSSLEVKSASIAWHFRRARPRPSSAELVAIKAHLLEVATLRGFDVMEGSCVFEVRLRDVNKGIAVRAIRASPWGPTANIFAAGDDVTDDDMMRFLDPADIGVAVTRAPREGQFALASPAALREMLAHLTSGDGGRVGS